MLGMGVGIGMRGVVGWNPSADASAVAWYVVGSDTTLVSGAASSVPNRVAAGANPAVQGTAGSRPTYEAAGWGGLPSLLFDGVDDFLTADGLATPLTGNDKPFTLAMAIEPLASDARGFWSVGRSTLDTAYMQVYGGDTNLYTFRKDDSGGAGVFKSGAMSSAKHIVVVSFTGTVIDALVDDVSVITAQAMNVGIMTSDRVTIGALGRSTYSNHKNFRLRELALFSRAFTVGAETTTLFRSLRSRSPV